MLNKQVRQVVNSIDFSQVEIWSLVLLAVNISHRIEKTPNGWGILVSEDDYERADKELAFFEHENAGWPPPKPEPVRRPSGAGRLPILMALALAAFYNYTGPWMGNGNMWFRQGMVNSRAILHEGQWWRIITGLTLHADINHLLGNICFGALVLYYLGLEIGAGAALFLALVTGAAGNLLNAFFHGSGHQSVGFSTAIFGLIGVLSGLRLADRGRKLKGILGPLGAGTGLLAMLGSGGARTDLGAHLWGIMAGLVCGLLCHVLLGRLRPGVWRRWQKSWAALTLFLVFAAWHLALR